MRPMRAPDGEPNEPPFLRGLVALTQVQAAGLAPFGEPHHCGTAPDSDRTSLHLGHPGVRPEQSNGSALPRGGVERGRDQLPVWANGTSRLAWRPAPSPTEKRTRPVTRRPFQGLVQFSHPAAGLRFPWAPPSVSSTGRNCSRYSLACAGGAPRAGRRRRRHLLRRDRGCRRRRAHPAPTTEGHRTSRLLHRTFRIVFLGAFASNIGTWMQNVVLGAYAYDLTHSSMFVGVIIFAQLGPTLVLPMVGGLLAEKSLQALPDHRLQAARVRLGVALVVLSPRSVEGAPRGHGARGGRGKCDVRADLFRYPARGSSAGMLPGAYRSTRLR